MHGIGSRSMPDVCSIYLPQPAPVLSRYAQAAEEQPSTVGDIWLVEGVTGKNRLCNRYDVTQQRCRVWAHTVHHSAPKKKSVPSGEVTHAAAPPAPAPAVAETEKEESQ